MKHGWGKALLLIIAALFLTNCQFLTERQPAIFAVPEQISYEDEVELVQLSYEISRPDIDDLTRVKLFYRRGVLYDSLGFRAFAHSDLTHALELMPYSPELYNYLGVLSANLGDMESALLAFNSGLELDPTYEFIHLNRAIVLYNMQRYPLAREDAYAFYLQEPNEAYRLLWLYLIECELDANNAKNGLQQRYDAMSDHSDWSDKLLLFYLGRISERTLLNDASMGVEDNRQLAERLCETYFYLGKFYLHKGNIKRAELLFKYALASHIPNFIEHQQARFELGLLEPEEDE